jgi:hypothetical protein
MSICPGIWKLLVPCRQLSVTVTTEWYKFRSLFKPNCRIQLVPVRVAGCLRVLE